MFRHGDFVRLKDYPAGREPVGRVRSRPRAIPRVVYVNWPDGWAGYVRVEDIEHVRSFSVEALRAARAAWVPSIAALAAADAAVRDA